MSSADPSTRAPSPLPTEPSGRPEPAAPTAPPPTAAEIEAAARVLGAVVEDRSLLATVGAETRSALQRYAGEIARPDLKARKRLQKTILRNTQQARKDGDEALRRSSGIRRLREEPVFLTPLPPMPARGTDASGWWPVLPGSVEEGLSATPPAEPPAPEPGGAGDAPATAAGPELHAPRRCYVCKREYRRIHRFYDQLCPSCGDENELRRIATADLRGRVALVTGARVKIGYQAAILLLRAGCTVVACTRFPRDAAARYAREPDFEAWRDRLLIHGVDLRHTPSVEHLCHWLDQTLPRLDFQIHNACQTVRRPPGFYGHLIDDEHRPASALPPAVQELLRSDEALRAEHDGRASAAGLTRSALLSQASSAADLLLTGAGPSALEIFPKGVLDHRARWRSSRRGSSTRTCSRWISGGTTPGGSPSTRCRRWSSSRCSSSTPPPPSS